MKREEECGAEGEGENEGGETARARRNGGQTASARSQASTRSTAFRVRIAALKGPDLRQPRRGPKAKGK